MAVQLALPMPAPGVTPEEEARVHAFVDNILPKGVPSYVRRVLALRPLADADVAALRPHAFWMGPTPQGFVATVEVFDGGTINITVTGPLGGAGYSWRIPDGNAPIWWCGRWNKWVRDTKSTVRRKADDG
ncbi:hypothetical protein OMR07_12075 [Methylobacterium organophilum]|nr:hypothetical protein [Methylobacterium organophilum]